MKWLIAYIKLILLGLNGERRIDPPLLRNIRYYPLSLNIFTCVLIYKKIKLSKVIMLMTLAAICVFPVSSDVSLTWLVVNNSNCPSHARESSYN